MHSLTRHHSGRRIVASVVAVSAAAVLLAGCKASSGGPGGESPSPSQRALSKEEYVNQAVVICSVSRGKTAPPVSTAADYAAAFEAQIAVLKDEYDKLGSLEPPAADKAKLQEQLLDTKAGTIKAFEEVLPKVREAAVTGDKAATADAAKPGVEKAANLAGQTSAFLISYGLEACA